MSIGTLHLAKVQEAATAEMVALPLPQSLKLLSRMTTIEAAITRQGEVIMELSKER